MDYEINHLNRHMSDTISALLRNEFCGSILSEDFAYCLNNRMSIKERQVIEHLAEGYTDQETYKLMQKVFPSYAAYKMAKGRAKKKLLRFLGC